MILSSADVDEVGNLLAFAKASLPAEQFKLGSEYARVSWILTTGPH